MTMFCIFCICGRMSVFVCTGLPVYVCVLLGKGRIIEPKAWEEGN